MDWIPFFFNFTILLHELCFSHQLRCLIDEVEDFITPLLRILSCWNWFHSRFWLGYPCWVFTFYVVVAVAEGVSCVWDMG